MIPGLKGDNVEVTYRLSPIFFGDYAQTQVDHAVKAALHIVEEEYVRQAPGDTGDFKKGIQVRKVRSLEYLVESTATSNSGKNYPYFLFTGTGKLKGTPDQGYTSGHVRAGTVARGIGGIRPNKAAARAKKDSESRFISKVKTLLKRTLK